VNFEEVLLQDFSPNFRFSVHN